MKSNSVAVSRQVVDFLYPLNLDLILHFPSDSTIPTTAMQSVRTLLRIRGHVEELSANVSQFAGVSGDYLLAG